MSYSLLYSLFISSSHAFHRSIFKVAKINCHDITNFIKCKDCLPRKKIGLKFIIVLLFFFLFLFFFPTAFKSRFNVY